MWGDGRWAPAQWTAGSPPWTTAPPILRACGPRFHWDGVLSFPMSVGTGCLSAPDGLGSASLLPPPLTARRHAHAGAGSHVGNGGCSGSPWNSVSGHGLLISVRSRPWAICALFGMHSIFFSVRRGGDRRDATRWVSVPGPSLLGGPHPRADEHRPYFGVAAGDHCAFHAGKSRRTRTPLIQQSQWRSPVIREVTAVTGGHIGNHRSLKKYIATPAAGPVRLP
jgi:hypothetical protein